MRNLHFPFLFIGLCFCFFSCAPVTAQKATKSTSAKVKFDESLYDAVKWRNLGPFRGGRSSAVAGVAGKPNLYYMGSEAVASGKQKMVDKLGIIFLMDFLEGLLVQLR